MTSLECIGACRALGVAAPASRQHYQRVFRTGQASSGPLAPALLPLLAAASEPTPEGMTTKLVSQVLGTPPQPAVASAPASREPPPLAVESVRIPMRGRSGRRTWTLCVSSQVGCAMGCGFCETAQMGLLRSLTPSEIVAQWWNARFGPPSSFDPAALAPESPGAADGSHEPLPGGPAPIDNIVFMGMGEPLDNFEAVVQAIRVLTDHHGPAIPVSRITVSTVGRIDGLRRLGALLREPGFKRLGLAVSINAPNDGIRSAIMPINRAMPMADLRDALLNLGLPPHRKLCFEYVLIPGVNDAPEHAAELAEYLRPFAHGTTGPRGMINVIPYNPRRDSPWPAPDEPTIERFVVALSNRGLLVKRRRTKGRAHMAACGQLGAAHIRARRLVPLSASGTPA